MVVEVSYMNSKISFSDIILESFKLSFQRLDRFCTGGQLEIAVVVLIILRECQQKCNLMSFSLRGLGNNNGDAF